MIINNQGIQEDVIKTNYKCIRNRLNQWCIKTGCNNKCDFS